MSDRLPPSKFGAGYTRGGGPDPRPSPPPTHTDPSHRADPPTDAAPTRSAADSPVTQPPVTGYPSTPTPSASPWTGGAAPAYGSTPFPPPAGARAGGAAALIAGVLALLLALARGFKTYGYFVVAQALSSLPSGYPNDGGPKALFIIATIVSAVGTVALLGGALMLFNRNLSGRNWITLGCVIAIADAVLMWLSVYVFVKSFTNFFSSAAGMGRDSVGGIFSSVLSKEAPLFMLSIALTVGLPLLTLILARSGSTRRWCTQHGGGYYPATPYPGPVPPAAHPGAYGGQSTPNAGAGGPGVNDAGGSHADYYRQAAAHFGGAAADPGPPAGPTSYPWTQPPSGPNPPPFYSPYWLARIDAMVSRLMERGIRGELFRQPWFHDIRGRSPDPFVYSTYAGGVVLSLLLELMIPSLLLSTVLTAALWLAIGYLYFAVGTKLAHLFLQFGICAVGALVMLWRVWTVVTILSVSEGFGGFYGAADPAALLLLDLLLNAAGAAALIYLALQIHRGIQRFTAP